ncbi:MHO_4530 family protein [Mycoplasma sp. VS410B]|uniref:MHO_4530 family protein n=1 Tax=Mycoplasma sp. VS410B TaxID=3401688 RepID=UPI003AAE7A25
MPTSSIIGVVIGVFVAIILLTFLFFLTLYFFYARSSSGIILFMLDASNKRVLRLSEKNYAFSTIFDAKRLRFQQYKFIQQDTFLDVLDDETKQYITSYIEEGIARKQEIPFTFNPNIKTLLTPYERLIYWFDRISQVTSSYVLKIYPTGNGQYNCTITFSKQNEKFNSLNKISNDENIFFDTQFKQEYSIIIAFALKPYYMTKEIESEFLEDLFNQFDLSYKRTPIFRQNGFLFLVIKDKGKHIYNNYLNKIRNINNNINFNKCFIAATIFKNAKLATEYSREMLLAKIAYSLFNILNDFNNYANYLDLPLDFINTPQFKEFNNQLVRYRNENSLLNKDLNNMHINFFPIKNYQSQKSSNLTIASVSNDSYDVADNKWNDFFRNIPILNYEYEKYWYEYVEKNSNKTNHNLLVKVSQEVYLNKDLNNTKDSPICLIYAYNNVFDHLNLKRKIEDNFRNSIPTALYIDEIDKALINIINDTKLKAIVIGEKVTKHLNSTKVYFDCINVINLASNNNIKVIYENPPQNLDALIVLKAKVFACYYTEGKKI